MSHHGHVHVVECSSLKKMHFSHSALFSGGAQQDHLWTLQTNSVFRKSMVDLSASCGLVHSLAACFRVSKILRYIFDFRKFRYLSPQGGQLILFFMLKIRGFSTSSHLVSCILMTEAADIWPFESSVILGHFTIPLRELSGYRHKESNNKISSQDNSFLRCY